MEVSSSKQSKSKPPGYPRQASLLRKPVFHGSKHHVRMVVHFQRFQRTMTIDLFELQNPKDLFVEIQSAIVEYYERPTSRLLLFLIFSLNHLREWIAGKSYEEVKAKIASKSTLTPEEAFYCQLWNFEEFRTINSLCNRSKHHLLDTCIATSVTEGFTVDSPLCDSFGQIYYRINGVDSREIFLPIIREYNNWFATHG